MDINVLCRIAMGIYKHQEDPMIQVSYKSKLVWIKGKKGWREYRLRDLVNEYAPNNEYIRKMAGMA